MRLSVKWAWYDWWVGAYWDRRDRVLVDAGYKGRLDGMTPLLDGPRGENIAMFLRHYPGRHIRGYGGVAILDDDGDMAPLLHRLVKTDARFGLQNEHTEAAIKLLCDPFDPELELPCE